jgi:predicted NUDIX family phosphoesterase
MKSVLQQRAEAAAERLKEEILFLPVDTVAPLFESTTWIGKTAAQQLVESFTTEGAFRSRETVESDITLVQALPVVVVRNRSGDLLRLKRREQRKDNPLHGKIVIWAGGHVRREDGANGPSIGQGAVRELQEELRLSIEPRELEMLGAVWIRGREGDRTRRHVAIVY